MADAQVLYAESVTATTASTTTFVDVVEIAANQFTANKEYLIIATAALEHASASNRTQVRLVHGETPTLFDDHPIEWEGLNGTQVHQGQFMFRFTQPSTTERIRIQIASASTTTVTNRLSQIIAIKLSDDFTSGTDYYWDENTADYTITTTATAEATTASFTPNGTDRWLYIGNMVWDPGGITDEIGFELYDSVAGVLGLNWHEAESSSGDRLSKILCWAGVPSNSARTVAVRPDAETGGIHFDLASRVIAINLAKFAQSASTFDATEVDPATSPSWTTLATIAPTPDTTGDWVYLGFMTQDVNETTTDFETRIQVNPSGGGLVDDPAYPNTNVPGIDQWDPLDEVSFMVFKKRSLSSGASRTINFDARQVAGTTGRIEDRGLVAFSVALASSGVTGSGGVTITKPTVSGTGAAGASGSGGVTITKPTLSGTGAETFTGSGGVVITKPTLSGTGAAGAAGSGGVIITKPTLAGTAMETMSGSGGLTITRPSISGTGAERFTGSGGVTITKPTISGTGEHTAGEGVTGSGGVIITKPTVAGSGTETMSGSGGLTISKPTVAGTGAEGFTGSGGLTISKPSVSGTGAEVFTGTGAVTIAKPTVAGTGTQLQPVTGSGGLTITRPAISGTGTGGEVEVTPRSNNDGTIQHRPPGGGLDPSKDPGGRGRRARLRREQEEAELLMRTIRDAEEVLALL